jgi:prolipoprotein diacylglyceryltransferase
LAGQHWEQVATRLSPFAIPIAIVVVIILAVAWWLGRRLADEEESMPEKAVPGRV